MLPCIQKVVSKFLFSSSSYPFLPLKPLVFWNFAMGVKLQASDISMFRPKDNILVMLQHHCQ